MSAEGGEVAPDATPVPEPPTPEAARAAWRAEYLPLIARLREGLADAEVADPALGEDDEAWAAMCEFAADVEESHHQAGLIRLQRTRNRNP